MPRIRANAYVDPIREPVSNGKGLTLFAVEVWGRDEPYDFVRHYQIEAKSDNYAAQRGIERFCREMEEKFPNTD